jgi:hypothetical protein
VRVYVESNFVLEIALRQEEVSECAALTEDSISKRVTLVLPAFSVFEPYYKIAGNGRKRRDLVQQVGNHARELGRTRGQEEISRNLLDTIQVLAKSEDAEHKGLYSAVARILSACELIPLTSRIVERALTEIRSRLDLELPDALVYTSVLEHLRENPEDDACFVTKNTKDFADPDIETELGVLRCRLLTSFGDAVRYVRR